jgi:glycyl-tRNA synthetase (class II)
MTDECVTVRERDSMKQERVRIEHLRDLVMKRVSMNALLENLV